MWGNKPSRETIAERAQALRVTVVGPEGSGKTAVLRILAGALRALNLKYELVRDENLAKSEVMIVESLVGRPVPAPKIVGYLVERAGTVPYMTRFEHVADHAKLTGWTVTPILSAL